MLIAGSSLLELLSPDIRSLQKKGYKTLLVYRSAPPKKDPKLVTSAEWRWKSLLKGVSDGKLEAKRKILQEKRSERAFTCTLCHSAWRSVEAFTTHLQGLDHEVKIQWEKLKEKLKERDQLASQGEHEQGNVLEAKF
ncbi:unnamed protein product [Microthlaspi erraticum]|uniref:C2H2-type domain-containing protein n=1 Tax=Microthlaspi erraticum TaxID=1685480 RepID=A0A6D2LGW3_9BRAS|nr:unnamed protein product [Microthlaspi erraticum]